LVRAWHIGADMGCGGSKGPVCEHLYSKARVADENCRVPCLKCDVVANQLLPLTNTFRVGLQLHSPTWRQRVRHQHVILSPSGLLCRRRGVCRKFHLDTFVSRHDDIVSLSPSSKLAVLVRSAGCVQSASNLPPSQKSNQVPADTVNKVRQSVRDTSCIGVDLRTTTISSASGVVRAWSHLNHNCAQ
jgi:hypothetical protein